MQPPRANGLRGTPGIRTYNGRMATAILAELKRRRVFRALAAYAIVAFAVLQVIEPVIHGLHLPDWVLSFVVVALGVGLPIVLVLAWIFDLGPAGIERTDATEASAGSRFAGRHVAVLLAHMLLDTLLERDNLASHLACNPSLQAGHIGQEGGSLVPIVAHAVQPEMSIGQHALVILRPSRPCRAADITDHSDLISIEQLEKKVEGMTPVSNRINCGLLNSHSSVSSVVRFFILH